LIGESDEQLKNVTNNIDFFNILSPEMKHPLDDENLNIFMNKTVKEALKIPDEVTFGEMAYDITDNLKEDFSISVTDIVESLLNFTDINVVVYGGQLDMICPISGTTSWINNMNWIGKHKYQKSDRNGIFVDGILEGFERHYRNFHMYWILRSGHLVPSMSINRIYS
jgi:serine carboxypeptidase 1